VEQETVDNFDDKYQ